MSASIHNMSHAALIEAARQRRVDLYKHQIKEGASPKDARQAALTGTTLGTRSLKEVARRCDGINSAAQNIKEARACQRLIHSLLPLEWDTDWDLGKVSFVVDRLRELRNKYMREARSFMASQP